MAEAKALTLVVLVVPVWAVLDQHTNKKMTSEVSACGHCKGICFEGDCLFDGPDEDQHNDTASPETTHPPLLVAAPETQKLPVSPKALKAAPIDSTGGILSVAELWRFSKGEQQALQGDVAFLSTATSALKAELQADEQQLQSLRSEKKQLESDKMQLQQQLRTSRTALADITAREARVVELIGALRNSSSVGNSLSYGFDSWSSVGSWILATIWKVRDTASFIQSVIFMLMFMIGVALMWKFRSRFLMLLFETEEVKFSWQDLVWSCISCCGVCWPLEPLGRALGLAYQAVEISEIQLGHLLIGGDVFVSIDIGTNPLMNTRTINKSDGVFLRFNETFRVNVRKTDAPCLFKVIDQDVLISDQIAQLEINAREFVNMATKGSADANSGYFRFDLQHRERKKGQGVKMPRTRSPGITRPYIAMRLREVTGDKFAGVSGEYLEQRSGAEFLETLKNQPGENHFILDPNTNALKLP